VTDHVSLGNGSAPSLSSSATPTFIASSPLSSSLPEVLADRATGGSLTVSQTVSFIEAETGVRVHRATVWRRMLRGQLPSFRVGGKVRTTKRAVLAMLEADAQRRKPTTVRADEVREEVARAGAAAADRIAGMGSN
jgi:hypothetical protein